MIVKYQKNPSKMIDSKNRKTYFWVSAFSLVILL